MIVSSRTPEGRPNHCPFCNADILLEPSLPFGDAPCPECGQLLWFLNADNETRVSKPIPGKDVENWLVCLIADQLNVPEEEVRLGIDGDTLHLEEFGADSLDIVELAMEFEES